MTEHAVLIAVGGPAGMMLAAELALARIDVAVLERRPDHVLVGSRGRLSLAHDRGARSAWGR
jgi:3-(3-hydroxy-phenyl)propionate hydroxylase